MKQIDMLNNELSSEWMLFYDVNIKDGTYINHTQGVESQDLVLGKGGEQTGDLGFNLLDPKTWLGGDASTRKIKENTAITNTGITGKDGVWTPGGMDSSLEAATRYLTGNLPPQLGGSSTLQDAVNYAKGLPKGTSIGTRIKNALLNTGGQDYDEQGFEYKYFCRPSSISR